MLGVYPELMTRNEAAKRLRVALATLVRLTQSGELYSFRVGRQIRIPTAAVEAFMRGERYPTPDRMHDPDETGTANLIAVADELARAERGTEHERQADDDARAIQHAEIAAHTTT